MPCLKSACARQYGVKRWRVRESDQNTPLHGVNWRASPVRFSLMFVLSRRLFRQALVLRAGAIHNLHTG